MTEPLSLLRLILSRVDEEMHLIIQNTPVLLPAEVEGELSDFIRAAVDRGALLDRLRESKLLALATRRCDEGGTTPNRTLLYLMFDTSRPQHC